MCSSSIDTSTPIGWVCNLPKKKKKKTVSEISQSGANLLSDQKEILLYKPKSYGLALVYYSFILIADNIMCDAFVHLDSDAFHKFQICNFIC